MAILENKNTDKYNRKIEYMRISLTDRCNFRCQYCMPESGIHKMKHEDIISLEKVEEIVRAGAELGIKKVRLTGGEPLIRKNILGLIENINKIPGIEEICLTTNGALIYDMAEDLKEKGLTRINFSLDTLNPDKFREITRNGDLDQVLKGINKCIDLGFKIKINTVLVGGFNDDDLEDLIELTRNNVIDLRFIELMKMGETRDWDPASFIPNSVILDKYPQLELVGREGVANIYRMPGYKGRIGLISPVSNCFCDECNRIRLTSDGKLKPCLHSLEEIDLSDLEGEDLLEAIRRGIYDKPEKHHLQEAGSETDRNMNQVGG